MPTKVTTEAIEKSTFVISVSFTDEDDSAVVPNSGLTWTLTDMDGDVINNRENVSITPASTIYIVLQGDDLEIADSSNNYEGRIITVEGTYDSDLGSDLPMKDTCRFDVINLRKVT